MIVNIINFFLLLFLIKKRNCNEAENIMNLIHGIALEADNSLSYAKRLTIINQK